MEQLIVIFLLIASTTAEHESFLKTDDTLTCSKEISCPPFNSQYGTAICCEGKLCCVSPDVARRTQPHVGSCSSKCVNGAKVSCCEYEYSCCSTSLEINSVLIDYLLLEEEKYIRLDGELVYLHTVKESLKHLEEKYGSGYGNGYDSGYGNGYGSGYGNGYGSGYDSGYDSGYGSGYGNVNDYGEDYKESQENQRKEPTKIDRMLSILNKKQQDNQRKETRGYASGYGNSYGSGYGSGYDSDYGSGYDSGYDSGYGNEYDEDHKEPLENQRKETSGYGNGYDSGYDSGDGSGYDNDYGENYKEPQKNQRKEPTKIDRHRMLSKLKKKQQENRRKETGIGNEQTTTTSTLSSVCTSKIPCSWGSDLYGTEVCCKGKLCCLSWEVFDFVQSRMENSNNKLATNRLVNQQWDGCSNRCRDGTTVSCCEWYQCCFELQVDWVMQIGDWRSIRLDGTLASLETVKRRIQGENYDSANDYGDVAGTTTNTPNTHASASTATNDYDNDDGLVLNRVGEKTAKGAERKQIQGKTATYYRRLQEEGENDYDVVTDTTPTTASTTTTTTPNTTHTDPTTAPTTTTTPTITTPTTAPTTTPTTTPTTASTTTTNAYANDYGNVTTTNPTTPTTSINPTTPTTSTNPTTTTTTTTPTTTTTTTATTNDYDNDDGLLLNRVGDKTANGTERKQIQGKTAGLYRRLQDQENSPSKDDPQKTENVTTAEVDGKLMPQEAFYALFALLCCGIVAGIAFTGHKLKLLKRDLRVGSVSQGSAANKDFRTVVPEIPQEKCSQQHNQTKHPWQPQPMQGDYSGQPRNDGYEY